MPIGTSDSYGPAIALESAAIEREIERARQQQQQIAASNDRSTPVPERFRQAVNVARARLDQAEAAWAHADQQARLRIRQANPSEALQKLWYEEGTIAAHNEREAAKAALASAELALGEQVQARRTLETLEASAPALHAQIDQECQQRHTAVDRELLLARSRCAM